MFCFVDSRNRPQYKYIFHSREKAREYLRKIQNNPLGVTIIHANGRREYFASGLPANLLKSQKDFQIKKGCHIKYKIRPLAVLDGIIGNSQKAKTRNIANWKMKSASPFFMLGNLKFSACLFAVSIIAFSFSYFLQKNLGQTVTADGNSTIGIVLGAQDIRNDSQNQNIDEEENSLRIADENVILNLLEKAGEKRREAFEKEILTYIKGRPMEAMAPYIAKQPRIVAAFLVGIAMKESKFGTYAPHLNGRDCHNYWGFKGGGTTTAGGYTCFDSPEEAIRVVGNRISKLVDGGRTSPSAMVIWKCGSSCSWDKPENVRKWIADVSVNFYRINSKQNS